MTTTTPEGEHSSPIRPPAPGPALFRWCLDAHVATFLRGVALHALPRTLILGALAAAVHDLARRPATQNLVIVGLAALAALPLLWAALRGEVASALVVAAHARGEALALREAFRDARGGALRVLAAELLRAALVLGAAALVLGPLTLLAERPRGVLGGAAALAGLVAAALATRLSLVVPLAAVERAGPLAALARSWARTRGHGFRLALTHALGGAALVGSACPFCLCGLVPCAGLPFVLLACASISYGATVLSTGAWLALGGAAGDGER